MKIVFVISSMGFGGAERVVSVLANQFVREHDVKIITTSTRSDVAYALDSRVELCSIPSPCSNLQRWTMVRRLCVEYRADVVLAFMDTIWIMTSLSLAFTSIPVIASERNDPSEKSLQLSGAFRILRFFANYLTSWFVFQSEGARSYYPQITQRKSCVILNPLNVENLPLRDESCMEKKVVNVGRLCPQKNQMLLLEAFGESDYAKDHQLYIYGEGELRQELEQKIRELQLEDRVFLPGSRSDVHELIRNAALFAFTSDFEGLPNALIEAMAMGIPCVSTDCSPGGARMLVDHRTNGLLVPCNDKKALVEAMNWMYRHPELAEACGRNARDIRSRVEKEKIAGEWLRWIRHVRGGRRM